VSKKIEIPSFVYLKQGLSEEHRLLVYQYAHGMEGAHRYSVLMETKRFVIFKCEGHKYWSGLYMPWTYAPVQFVLVAKGDGAWDSKTRRWEGRMTKAMKADMVKHLNASEKKGKLVGENHL
jgi:hypothetical protein